MKIGQTQIRGAAGLAPMAGVADRAFRALCAGYGAAFVVGEMVSAKGLTYGDKKSEELLRPDMADEGEERSVPTAVQLFGDDPQIMAQAARMAEQLSPDWIDINMGCPAPKIVGNHCGSALMREPELCRRLVQAVRDAVRVPVTVKLRKGYSKTEPNVTEVALACEAGGADTMVELDGQMLGKPRTADEAVEMLLRLQGREHRVLTGVWLIRADERGGIAREDGFTDAAAVRFFPMSAEEARAYVATGEPMDKAGAYGIQGYGMRFVEGICGDFYTVMGLPGGKTLRFLHDFAK